MREQIEKSARHLYGLVHARYIVTTRGLAKMVSLHPSRPKRAHRLRANQLEKYKKGDFGKCPRVMCEHHPLLPMGMSDNPNVKAVKLYCAKCEDLYNPKSSRHAAIDGAYFGTSFQNILFQVYPALIPKKSQKRYEPRIYGFRVHAAAALMRWQEVRKAEMKDRLRRLRMENGFEDDGDGDGDGDDDGASDGDDDVDVDVDVDGHDVEIGDVPEL